MAQMAPVKAMIIKAVAALVVVKAQIRLPQTLVALWVMKQALGNGRT